MQAHAPRPTQHAPRARPHPPICWPACPCSAHSAWPHWPGPGPAGDPGPLCSQWTRPPSCCVPPPAHAHARALMSRHAWASAHGQARMGKHARTWRQPGQGFRGVHACSCWARPNASSQASAHVARWSMAGPRPAHPQPTSNVPEGSGCVSLIRPPLRLSVHTHCPRKRGASASAPAPASAFASTSALGCGAGM